MSEPKFKVGQLVLILSRGEFAARNGGNYVYGWDNSGAGQYAIIHGSHQHDAGQHVSYKPGWLYSLIILENGEDYYAGSRECSSYEEEFLELYCSNEEKGKEFIKNRFKKKHK